MSLANELLKEFEQDIETVSLIPSDGGRFEVSVNGKMLYSKLETRRQAEPGEVLGLLKKQY